MSCEQVYFNLCCSFSRSLSLELEVAVIRETQHWTTFRLKEEAVIIQVVNSVEDTKIRKADRTVEVHRYIFSNISSGTA